MFGFPRRQHQRRNVNDTEPRIRKFREKHIVSALLGAATISILCCSLAEPVWFQLHSEFCCYNYIGIAPFMHSRPYEAYLPEPDANNCKLTNSEEKLYSSCINEKAIMTIQVLSSVILLTIFTSLFAFSLDVIAPKKYPFWKVVKRYSFGYILTVIFSATSLGFAYWASEEIYNHMFSIVAHHNYRVNLKVNFGMGVYLTAAAGCLSVLAVASNLMRQYPTAWEEQAEELALISDDENDDIAEIDSSVVPPAYSP